MSSVINSNSCDILYLIRQHIASIVLSMSSFYNLVAPLSHKHVIPSTVVALCFFPTQRETVTIGKGSLVPLDELKLLISNVGSLLMASLL